MPPPPPPLLPVRASPHPRTRTPARRPLGPGRAGNDERACAVVNPCTKCEHMLQLKLSTICTLSECTRAPNAHSRRSHDASHAALAHGATPVRLARSVLSADELHHCTVRVPTTAICGIRTSHFRWTVGLPTTPAASISRASRASCTRPRWPQPARARQRLLVRRRALGRLGQWRAGHARAACARRSRRALRFCALRLPLADFRRARVCMRQPGIPPPPRAPHPSCASLSVGGASI